MKELALIYTGDAVVWDPAAVSLWERALRAPAAGFQLRVYRLSTRGELPPAGAAAAVVVTGSHHNTCERLPWMAALQAFLRVCAAAGVPVVGACFGAQLAAEAFGGTVAPNPSGRFILKAEALAPTPAFVGLPAAAGLVTGAPLRVLESHGYAVAALPPGGVLLAASASCAHEAFLAAPGVLCLQGHAEFLDETVRDILWPRVSKRLTPEERADAEASFKEPRHDSVLREVIRRFLFGVPAGVGQADASL